MQIVKGNLTHKRGIALLATGIFLLALIVNSSAIDGEYNFDDYLVTQGHPLTSKGIGSIPEIYSSPYYTDDQGYSFDYRPTTLASFALEKSIFGESPKVSHSVNLLLFGATCVLIFLVLVNLFPDQILASSFMGLLFAVHPIHTEVIACIKNRDEILALLFMVMALGIITMTNTRVSFVNPLLALVFFALSLSAKISAITLVLLVPILLNSCRNWEYWARWLFYLLTSSLFGLIIFKRILLLDVATPLAILISLLTIDIISIRENWTFLSALYESLKNCTSACIFALLYKARKYFSHPVHSLQSSASSASDLLSSIFPVFKGRLWLLVVSVIIVSPVRSAWLMLTVSAVLVFLFSFIPKKLQSRITHLGLLPIAMVAFANVDFSVVMTLSSVYFITTIINPNCPVSISGFAGFISTSMFFGIIDLFVVHPSNGDRESVIIYYLLFYCVLITFFGLYKSFVLPKWSIRRAIMLNFFLMFVINKVSGDDGETLSKIDNWAMMFIGVIVPIVLRRESGEDLAKLANWNRLFPTAFLALLFVFGNLNYADSFITAQSSANGVTLRQEIINYLHHDYHLLTRLDADLSNFVQAKSPYSIRKDVVTNLEYIKTVQFSMMAASEHNRLRPLQALEYPLPLDADLSIKFGTAADLFSRYIGKCIIPFPLAFYYGYDEIKVTNVLSNRSLLGMLLLSSMLILGLITATQKNYLIAFGLLIWSVALIPFLGIYDIVPGTFGDRFTYVASLGQCMFYAGISARLLGSRKKLQRYLALTIIISLILVEGAYSYHRNGQWNTDLELMRNDITHVDRSAQAHAMLAKAVMKNVAEKHASMDENFLMKNIDEAELHFRRSIEIFPYYFNTYVDLGRLYMQSGQLDKAEPVLAEALKIDSTYYPIVADLASINSELGNVKKAQLYLDRLIELRPYDFESYDRLSFFLFRTGDIEGSIAALRTAIEVNPNHWQPWFNMSQIYLSVGDTSEHVACMKRAEQLKMGQNGN